MVFFMKIKSSQLWIHFYLEMRLSWIVPKEIFKIGNGFDQQIYPKMQPLMNLAQQLIMNLRRESILIKNSLMQFQFFLKMDSTEIYLLTILIWKWVI